MSVTPHSAWAFFDALGAGGPQPQLARRMSLYDRVLGSWSLDAVDHDADGTRRVSSGEVHFAWVLEGRAIQDVWIVPARPERQGELSARGNRYGTTLRVYDPAADVWRITWINPVSGAVNQLTGRGVGEDIVQEGSSADGQLIRWSFRAITADSFHWLGEVSPGAGMSWRLQVEFFARRLEAAPPIRF